MRSQERENNFIQNPVKYVAWYTLQKLTVKDSMLTILQTTGNSLDYSGARHLLHPSGMQLYWKKILQLNHARSVRCKKSL